MEREAIVVGVRLTDRSSRVLSLTASGLLQASEDMRKRVADARDGQAVVVLLAEVADLLVDLTAAVLEASKVAMQREKVERTSVN